MKWMIPSLRVYFSLLFFSVAILGISQTPKTTFMPAEPEGGLDAVLSFLDKKVKLRRAERREVSNQELYVELEISEEGKVLSAKVVNAPVLSVAQKIQKACMDLPDFIPATYEGIEIESLYRFTLNYQKQAYFPNPRNLYVPDYDEFAEIIEKPRKFDLYFNGSMNFFGGNIGQRLGLGGGIGFGMLFGGKHFSAGFDMTIYGNKLRRNFDLEDERKQYKAPPTFYVGLTLAKEWPLNKKRSIQLQSHFNFASMNLIPEEENGNRDFVHFDGFSTGLRCHYLILLGKPKVSVYGAAGPTLFKSFLHVYVGAFGHFLEEQQASGVLGEIGIGYRMRLRGIKEYTLKDNKQIFSY